MNEKIQVLYNQLSQDGYDVGDINSFSQKMTQPDKARALYDTISKEYELGEFDSFYSKLDPNFRSPEQPKGKAWFGVEDKRNQQYEKPGENIEKERKQASYMNPDETRQILNQGVPGVTEIGDEKINHLQTNMLMQEKFGGNYKDTSSGKTEHVTPVSDLKPKAELVGGPIVINDEEIEQKKRPEGFFDYIGDSLNAINTGASQALAGVLGYGEKFYRNLQDISAYAENTNRRVLGLENLLGIPGLSKLFGTYANKLGEVKEYFKRDAAASMARTSNYEGKSFTDLWKSGKYVDSVAKLYTDATQSIPITLASWGAIATGNPGIAFGLMYASQTGNTIDELKDSDMGEWQKQVNAHLVGASEALSEMFGDVVMVGWLGKIFKQGGERLLKAKIAKGVKPFLNNLMKSNSLLIPPAIEGSEEFVNQLNVNIIDFLTGRTKEYKPLEGTFEAFIQGAAGGSQFSAVGATGMAYNQAVDYLKGHEIKTNFNHSKKEFTELLSKAGYTTEDIQSFETALLEATPERAMEIIKNIAVSVEGGVIEQDGKKIVNEELLKPVVSLYQDGKMYADRSKRLQSQIEEYRTQAKAFIEQNQNPDMGAIVYAEVAGKPVRVTKGNIVFNGDKLDRENSSKEFYYENENGEIIPANIELVSKLLEVTPIEQATEVAAQRMTAPLIAKEQNEEVRPYEVGEQVTIDVEGSRVMGQIVEKTENGYKFTDSTGMTIDIEPRQIIDEDNLQGVDNGVLVEYMLNGTPQTGLVEDFYQYRQQGQAIVDGNLINLSDIIGVSQPETDSNMSEITPENEGAPANEDNIMSENETNTPNSDIPAENQNGDFIPQYPVTKAGEYDFDNFTPEQLFTYTRDNIGEQEAIEDVKISIANIQSEIDKKKKGFDKLDMKGRVKAREAIRKLEEQKNIFEALLPTTTVQAEEQQPAVEAVPEIVEQPAKKIRERGKRSWQTLSKAAAEREKTWGEPQNLRELVLRYFSSDGRVSWKDKEGTKGLGAEYRYSEGERRKHIGLSANDAPTPEQLAHMIWEANAFEEGNFEDLPLYGTDTQEILNEILDVLNSFTKAQMTDEVNRMKRTPQEEVIHSEIVSLGEEIVDNFIEDFINNPEENPFFVGELTPEQKQANDELDRYFNELDSKLGSQGSSMGSEEGGSNENNQASSPQQDNASPAGEQGSIERTTDVGGISGSGQDVRIDNGDIVFYQGNQYEVNGITTDGLFVDLELDGKPAFEDIPVSEVSKTNNIRNEQSNETGLDNGRAVEDKSERLPLGAAETWSGIYSTVEASNNAGEIRPDYSTEEREELEARGINPYWDNNIFRRTLREQAKQNRVWLDDYIQGRTLIHNQKTSGTSENDIYEGDSEETIIKVNNLAYAKGSEHHHNFSALIDRIEAHNDLFPNVAYTIKGFAENKDGHVSLVLEQPFVVDIAGNSTQEEINEELTKLGFKLSTSRPWSNGHKVWTNGEYELFDARPANVLKGNDGNLYFIDTFPHSVRYMNDVSGQSLAEESEAVKELRKEIKDIKSQKAKLIKEMSDRNGLFGDTKSDPNDLFGGGEVDSNAFVSRLDEINNRINTVNDKIKKQIKAEATGKTEARKQQSISLEEESSPKQETSEQKKSEKLSETESEKPVNQKDKKSENDKSFPKEKSKENKSKQKVEKIEDFGEKIEGARKDEVRKYYNKINLNGMTLSTIFPKPNMQDLLKSGLSVKEASAIKVAYEFAQIDKKHIKNKERRAEGIKFYAAYAKTVLSENLNIEFTDNRWVFTDYGKSQIELRTSAYEAVAKELGSEYLDLDLSKISIRELTPEYVRRFVNKPDPKDKYEVAYYVSQAKRFETLEEALSEFISQVKANTKTDVVEYKRKINVYSSRQDRNIIYVGYQPKGKELIKLKEGFTSAREAFDYIKDNQAELQTELERILQETKQDAKPTVRLKYTNETARERVGKDWRGGENISSEKFATTFGFRGVEFGNWVNQKERQVFMNNAYDSLMDLSQLLEISPAALSLNGRLAVSFGSRGSGVASAHYEPERIIINLTKTKGLGSLAHEWYHAMDNYFAGFGVTSRGMKSATSGQFKDDVRTEMIEALKGVYDSFPWSYKERSRNLDAKRGRDYFKLPTEMAARAFENYILVRLNETGQVNDFLANYVSAEDWNGDATMYPYPKADEETVIRQSFDKLFNTIEETESGELREPELQYGKKLPSTININGVEKPTSNTGEFSPEDASILNEPGLQYKVSETGFYSTVEKSLSAITQEKGTRDQFKAMLLKNGAKQAELDWMGWDDQFPDARKKVSKEKQLDIIQNTNPMRDDIHVGIRKLEDIKTFDQVVDDPESFVYGDFSKEDAQKALKEGSVTVYSSTPIKNGAFVSTSEKQAKDYAGNGKVYSQKVNLSDVAWINGDEGQIAKVDNTITKADIQNWIDENRIEVQEVVKGYDNNLRAVESARDGVWMIYKGDEFVYTGIKANTPEEAINKYKKIEPNLVGGNLPKFSQYTLPSGENYKELLLTMPFGKDGWEQYKNVANKKTFQSSHFDEPNILAHVRFNERTVNGERVLFLEEIQSDWAQSIKKKGVRQGYDKSKLSEVTPDRYNEMGISPEKYSLIKYENENGQEEQVFQILKSQYPTVKDAINYISTSKVRNEGEPDNPFKKTDQWVNLALRRMMRYAAENGFDRIAWTTGEQQADRYDLSKQVDEIRYEKLGENYAVGAIGKNGEVVYRSMNATSSELEDAIGKEITQKIVNNEGEDGKVKGTKVLSGENLKVGGEGMKAFYDAIVPNAMSKLGKPFGAKVENIDIPTEKKIDLYSVWNNETGNSVSGGFTLDTANKFINERPDGNYSIKKESSATTTQQSIPVTESMRKTAMEGMPLFEPQQQFINFTPEEIQDETNKAHGSEENQRNSITKTVEAAISNTLLPDRGSAALREFGNAEQPVEERDKRDNTNSPNGKRTVLEGFKESGYVDFVGTEVSSHQDIADLWSIHRSPYIEKTHVIFIKDGKIAGSMAATSGRINQSMVNTPKDIAEHAKKIGATQVYLLHNHPSGLPNVSTQDVHLTFYTADQLRTRGIEVLGHVVVDHDKYSFIDATKNWPVDLNNSTLKEWADNTPQFEYKNKVPKLFSERERVEGPLRMFEIGKSILSQPSYKGAIAYLINHEKGQSLSLAAYDILPEGATKEDAIRIAQKGLDNNLGAMVVFLHDGSLSGTWNNTPKGTVDVINIAKKDFDYFFNQSSVSEPELEQLWVREGDVEYNSQRELLDAKLNKAQIKFANITVSPSLLREAYQDRHLPVRKFIEQLRETGLNIENFNDWYKQSTHLPRKIDAQLEAFERQFLTPMLGEIDKLIKQGHSYRDVENYAILKHGIERNEWFLMQEEKKYLEKNPQATKEEISEYLSKQPQDYSGITAVQEEVEMSAEDYIRQFEEKSNTDSFWNAVKQATKYSLDKAYEGQIINKDQYNELTNRYKYYIPLRGFDKETAEDRWDYTPDMGTYYVMPLIKAKGRTSRSETPFAFIWQMAQTSINSANKNLHNLSIKRLAELDNKRYASTGLMSISRAWYERTGENTWELRSPEYSQDRETYQNNIEEFEDRMTLLAEQGFATQKRGKLNVGLFIKPKQAAQHEVHVMQNGEEFVVYFNGNPRVARAINGANAIHNQPNQVQQAVRQATRMMAANFTTRNPLFVLSNFLRDYNYASSTLIVKEGVKYEALFQKNIPLSMGPLQRAIRGKSDMTNKMDVYAYEYLMNGGPTGYSSIMELGRVQKRVERKIKRHGKENMFNVALEGLKTANEFAENITRLSVYVTSREVGKDIIQSISDAKEVTVNFNRGGSGRLGGNFFKNYYLFFNANIQALANHFKIWKGNPGRMAALTGAFALSGFIAPFLTALIGGDDGEEEYMKLSDWERQTNFSIYTGNGFIKIPIAHELRVYHTMGDLAYQWMMGYITSGDAAKKMTLSVSDLIPANPMGATEASWAELSPDLPKPFIQLVTNTSFMGTRIYDKYKVEQDIPGFRMVRTNKKGEAFAPEFLIKLAEGTHYITGGDGTKGGLDFNPDKLNHVMRGYFGGLYTMSAQAADISSKGIRAIETGEFKLKVRETPLRTFYASSDDLMERNSKLNAGYYDIKKESDQVRKWGKDYIKRAEKGEISIDELYKKLNEINYYYYEGGSAVGINDFLKDINKMENMLKEVSPEEQEYLEMEINRYKKDLINFYQKATKSNKK